MLRNLCVKNVKVSILLPYFVATMQQLTFKQPRKEHTFLVHIKITKLMCSVSALIMDRRRYKTLIDTDYLYFIRGVITVKLLKNYKNKSMYKHIW